MTTQATKPEGESIPDFLKRTSDQTVEQVKAGAAKPAAMTSTPPTEKVVEAPAPKANRKARRAAASTKAKPAKAAKAKAEASTDEDEGPKITRSIVPVRYKARYAEHEDTCGTELSLALKHATTGKNEDGRMCLLVPELFAVADTNGIPTKPYKDLNNGQKRMNVYNRLVGMLNAGKDVTIGKKVFRAKNWTPPTKPGLKAKVAKDAAPVAAKPARKPKGEHPQPSQSA